MSNAGNERSAARRRLLGRLAIVSALFRDRHSDEAAAAARAPETHLMSSLALAEVQAVIARVEREQALSPVLVAAARESVERGPWVRLSVDYLGPTVQPLPKAASER